MAINAQLKSDFEQAAVDLFDDMIALGANEKYVEKVTFDAVSGAPTSGGEFPVRMLRDSLKDFEDLPEETETGDVVFTIIQKELSVTPKKTGFIFYGDDNTKHQIIGFIVDPADVLWQIVGRIA